MLGTLYQDLSRRERQIMDIIYRRGEATAAAVMDDLPDAPGYSAVRAMLRILEQRGYLTHRTDGQRYVYRAVVSREEAQSSALKRVVSTFFEDSVPETVAALLSLSDDLDEDDAARLRKLIEKARQEER